MEQQKDKGKPQQAKPATKPQPQQTPKVDPTKTQGAKKK